MLSIRLVWKNRFSRRSFYSQTRCMSTVMSFGDGSHGALGLPASEIGLGGDAYEPIPVPGLPSDITGVSAGHYHSLALDSRGSLWAWGRNNEGQLGRDSLASRYHFQGVADNAYKLFKFLLVQLNLILNLELLYFHDCHPSSSAKCVFEELNLICEDEEDRFRETWNEAKMVEGLEKVNVYKVFASGVVSAAISDDGSLWVWGKSKRGQLGLGKNIMEAVRPCRVGALSGEKIVKVSFGWGHALAQSEDGKLFGWGYCADGRIAKVGQISEASPLDSAGNSLGTQQLSTSALDIAEKLVLEGMKKEKDMPIIWEPSLVEELEGVQVVDISCGLDHSLVLCSDGTLLSCGSNVYGQLGREKQDLGMLPVDISSRPISIASGLGHSLAICLVAALDNEGDGKNIVTWGWNQSSQLGRTGLENIPLAVDGLVRETPVSVSGGRAHSIALTSKSVVWVWGCGKNGRLGLGSSSDESEPVLIDSLEGLEVIQVACGFDHSLVLIAE